MLFFFFNDTATTEIYTLSLHDALPIYDRPLLQPDGQEIRPFAAALNIQFELADRVDGGQHSRTILPWNPEVTMKQAFTLLLLVMLPSLVSAQPKQHPQSIPLVFTHVTVIDATGAPAKPDMTLVVVGDRITELGPTKKVRVPKDAQVVDATSKF